MADYADGVGSYAYGVGLLRVREAPTRTGWAPRSQVPPMAPRHLLWLPGTL